MELANHFVFREMVKPCLLGLMEDTRRGFEDLGFMAEHSKIDCKTVGFRITGVCGEGKAASPCSVLASLPSLTLRFNPRSRPLA